MNFGYVCFWVPEPVTSLMVGCLGNHRNHGNLVTVVIFPKNVDQKRSYCGVRDRNHDVIVIDHLPNGDLLP